MKPSHRRRKDLRGNPEPERLSVRLKGLEVCAPRDDGQFEYTAIAQFFDIVNDRLMVFRRGSFAKTIAENVGTGRIKINDAHRYTSDATLGTVVEARETDVGVWYRGLVSSTEERIYTKMRERHVDENSIEFFAITEGITRVPLDQVPVGAWIWDEAKGDGTVEVREMLEVAWVGIAILPFSSQGRSALLEVNAAVPFQDLPVAARSTAWDPKGAAERLAKWAGKISQPSRGDLPNYAKLSRGYLIRGPIHEGKPQLLGQIADVVDGELVVIPDALDAALEELAKVDALSGPDLVACARTVERYAERLRRTDSGAKRQAADASTVADGAAADVPSGQQTEAEAPAGPATEPPEEPPTDETASGEGAAGAALSGYIGRRLKLAALKVKTVASRYPEVLAHEPTDAGGGNSPGG